MRRYGIACLLLAIVPAAGQILPRGLAARWWQSPQMAEKLGLSQEQQKKMDDVFQQSRLKLIDLTAALDKAEAVLDLMVNADHPDADLIRVQIGRVADARAELEKANAAMLLGIRLLLTPAQWKTLQAETGGPRPRKLPNPGPDPLWKKIR